MTGPNVPPLPGVPQLPYTPGQTFTPVPAVTSDNLDNIPQSTPVWGIFDASGNLAIQADSVVMFNFKQSYELSDFQVEQGAFETYDKVQTPFVTRVRLTKGGSLADRQTFINTALAINGDFNLYSVVTPEISFTNVNMNDMEFHREAKNGVTLITVEFALQQIRQSASAQFSNTASAAGADPVSGGIAQPQTATQTQSDSLPDIQ